MRRTSLILGAVLGLVLAGEPSARGAGFMYFKDSPIMGQVTRGGQGGWIEIQSLNWGAPPPTAPPAPAPAGIATGGPGRIVVTKTTDASSTSLKQAAAKGKVFPDVQIQVLKAAKGPEAYLTYKLENVQITSYQLGATGGPAPSESLTLNFTKIEYKYAEQKSPGALKSRPAVKQ